MVNRWVFLYVPYIDSMVEKHPKRIARSCPNESPHGTALLEFFIFIAVWEKFLYSSAETGWSWEHDRCMEDSWSVMPQAHPGRIRYRGFIQPLDNAKRNNKYKLNHCFIIIRRV